MSARPKPTLAALVESPRRPKSGVERRGAKRHRVAAPVRWTGGTGTTRDVSNSGLSFDTTTPVTPGKLLKLTLICEPERPSAKPTYAFCEVLVLRVTPNAKGGYRVAAAFKSARLKPTRPNRA